MTRVTEDALLKAPGLQALRRDLLRSALRFYDEFLKQHGDDPDLRAALADVHLRVGKIQQDLGDATGGHKSFLAARSIYQELAKEKPDDRDVQAGLADCQFRLNDLPEAIGIYEKLIKLDPTNPRYRRDLAEAYNSQATSQKDASKVAEVLEAHRKALALREGLVREFPDDPEARNNLGGTLNNLGVVLNRQGHTAGRAGDVSPGGRARRGRLRQGSPGDPLRPSTWGRNIATWRGCSGPWAGTMRRFRADQREIEHWRRLTRREPRGAALPGAALFRAASTWLVSSIAQGRKPEAAEWFDLAGQALEDQPRKTGGDLYNLACVRARAAAAIAARQGDIDGRGHAGSATG